MKKEILFILRGDKSRADVARDLGITPQGLGMIERGDRTPRPELMKKIANYYNKTVDEIFFKEKRHVLCLEEAGNLNVDSTTSNPTPAA